MENIVKKICPASELRHILMPYNFDEYHVTRIEKISKSEDYLITLELNV
jgi:hypothetical protein